MSSHEGMRKNVALVATLREALGDDYDIMIDCWQSLNLDYAVDFCSRIEELRPRWIEECFMPDRIDSYVKLKAKTWIPWRVLSTNIRAGASSGSSRRIRWMSCSPTCTGAAVSAKP